MTKKRMATLGAGVTILSLLSLWKLRSEEDEIQTPPQQLIIQQSPSGTQTQLKDTELASFKGESMGTTYLVKYVPPHSGVLSVAPVVAAAALSEVVASMSAYEPKSEVTVFNSLPAKTPFRASPEFFEVMRLAADIYEKSDGAFDVTVRPLIRAYGFESAAQPEAPLPGVLQIIRQRIGMDKLLLDEENQTLTKTVEGIEVDLGGIAQGYGVDRVALALEKIGISSYLIELGGEIRMRGLKHGAVPWLLGIDEPSPHVRKLHVTLSLPEAGAALATSGDYRHFPEHRGKLVSRTFDPRSGKPVPRRTASVSIIRPTAAEADGLATALYVLEPEHAISLANKNGWPVYLLLHQENGKLEPKMSDAFKRIDWRKVEEKLQ